MQKTMTNNIKKTRKILESDFSWIFNYKTLNISNNFKKLDDF